MEFGAETARSASMQEDELCLDNIPLRVLRKHSWQLKDWDLSRFFLSFDEDRILCVKSVEGMEEKVVGLNFVLNVFIDNSEACCR